MTHLTDEQIYNLAELTEEMLSYSETELEQMEHLKICEICYNKFCAARVISEITSENGYAILSEIYQKKSENIEEYLEKRILAVLKVIRDNFRNQAIKQIKNENSRFQFGPQLAYGMRGFETEEQKIHKVEDIEDEKTFIVFDSTKSELFVQINVQELENKDIRVTLEFENNQNIEVPVVRKGIFVKGTIENIPDKDFEIRIENVN